MKLSDMLECQRDLDELILQNHSARFIDLPVERKKQIILVDTILALMVEVGEFANELKGDGFKHWSTKTKSEKEVLLEELIDVYHFVLSITNQMEFSEDDIQRKYIEKHTVTCSPTKSM